MYILWNPKSHLPPRVTLDTREKAEEVAQQMAAKHEQAFFIAHLVAKCEPIPVATKLTALDAKKKRHTKKQRK